MHLLPLLLCAALQGNTESKPPNILLLLSDDQRPDSVSAWGNDFIATPSIDSLAQAGFSLRNAHCMGSPHGAICQPSRAMLHTGRAYHQLNIGNLAGRELLGEILGAAGFTTFGTGKWHNSKEAFKRSFQEGKAIFFGGMCDHNEVSLIDLADDKYNNKRTGKGHSSDLFANAAVDFLKSTDGSQPFFCSVAFTAPHDPRTPPNSYSQHYYENRPPLPSNFLPQHPFDCGWMQVRDENLAGWPRTKEVISDQLCEYYGLITHMDEAIGRILTALEETGQGQNTLVIFAADHGLAMGSHGLLGKQSLYQHSMGLPLILRGPNIPADQSSNALVYLLDVFPTILEAANLPLADDLQAHSLWPLVDGSQQSLRETLFTSLGRHQRAIRDDRWKLIRYPEIDHLQLFDLQTDPDERENLAARPEHAGTISRLRRSLGQWQEYVGDDVPWTAKKVRDKEVDLTGASRKPDRWQPEWVRKKYFGE